MTITQLSRIMIESACRIAEEVHARALVMDAEAAADFFAIQERQPCSELVLVTRNPRAPEKQTSRPGITLDLPEVSLTRLGQVKIAVTKGIAAGIFKKGDKIVCLSGVPKFGVVDSIFVIDVGREFEILTLNDISDITEGLHAEIFGELINIALKLAAQGREGRKVGTIFVLGDHDKVLQLSRQMIINPFQGYPEKDRNILNPDLMETIREFSALDGAFIIKDDGTIVTACRHLNTALESKEFPEGLGSRHIAAAGMTSVTNAVAIVLSESSGTVSVFKNGKMLVSIERPLE